MLGKDALCMCPPAAWRRLRHVGQHITPAAADPRQLRVGAHRGAMCYAPENTLAAFEAAILHGVYRIECDVRSTRDGVLVLMHDPAVDRTTDGSGSLRDMDFNTLRSLRAVMGAGGGVGSELVPTLREALACAKGRCQLLVELKDEDIADRVVAEVTEAGMVDSCTISSFHEPSLQRCREVSSIGTCYFIGTNETSANLPVATLVGQLGVSLVCVVGAQKLALGPAPERAEAAAWLAQAREQGLQTRCGFADTISKQQARITFSVMVDELGVEEVSCGRPDWIAEFIRDHPG